MVRCFDEVNLATVKSRGMALGGWHPRGLAPGTSVGKGDCIYEMKKGKEPATWITTLFFSNIGKESFMCNVP